MHTKLFKTFEHMVDEPQIHVLGIPRLFPIAVSRTADDAIKCGNHRNDSQESIVPQNEIVPR